MNDYKSEMGKEIKINPQEALNVNDMKKVLESMLSYENFVNLNARNIMYEEKLVKQEEEII